MQSMGAAPIVLINLQEDSGPQIDLLLQSSSSPT